MPVFQARDINATRPARCRSRYIFLHRCRICLLCVTVLCLSAALLFGQDALVRARRELDADHTAEAISLLEDYRRAHPADAEVYNLLGVAYGRIGDDDRSLAMFQQLARLAPDKPQVYNNLGAAYLRKGKVEEADGAFRHALRLSPNDVGALYNLGALLNAGHKYKESRPLLEKALRLERSPPVAYEAAVALAGTGDRAAALRILNSIHPPVDKSAVPWLRLSGTLNLDEGNIGAAADALEQALVLAPDDQESAYALAIVRVKSNQAELALPLLDKAFASLPSASRLVREGTVLSSYGAYPQALSLFEQAVKDSPDSYDAQYDLAVVRLEHFKDASGALEAAQHALTVKETGEVHDLLGDICEAQGQYVEAVKHYEQAVRLDPSDDKFAFDLGAELIAHENYDAARTVFHAAQERFPRVARIYLGAGTAEFLRGKTEAAVDAYLKAVDLSPDYEPAYLFLGEAFSFSEGRSAEVVSRLSHFAGKKPESFGAQFYYGAALVKDMETGLNLASSDRATAVLRRAESLKPGDARVYYMLGEVLRLEKHLVEAAKEFQKSIALDPNYPEPLYKLGQVYLRLGEQGEAKAMFARHREVLAKTEADLYHRSSEIQSFVLTMKSSQ
ncbi:MAG: tetratricopeptide repeat protein [Candidatus Sulfotelmatobacter sp.]